MATGFLLRSCARLGWLCCLLGLSLALVEAGPIFDPGPDGPVRGNTDPTSLNSDSAPRPPVRGGAIEGVAPSPARDPSRVEWPEGAPGLPGVSFGSSSVIQAEAYRAGRAPAEREAVFRTLKSKAAKFGEGKGGEAPEEVIAPAVALRSIWEQLGTEGLTVVPVGADRVAAGGALRIPFEVRPGEVACLVVGTRPAGQILDFYFAEPQSGLLLGRAMMPSGQTGVLRFTPSSVVDLELVVYGNEADAGEVDLEIFLGWAKAVKESEANPAD